MMVLIIGNSYICFFLIYFFLYRTIEYIYFSFIRYSRCFIIVNLKHLKIQMSGGI